MHLVCIEIVYSKYEFISEIVCLVFPVYGSRGGQSRILCLMRNLLWVVMIGVAVFLLFFFGPNMRNFI